MAQGQIQSGNPICTLDLGQKIAHAPFVSLLSITFF